MQAVLPDDIKVSFEFDQSPTVTNADVEPWRPRALLGAVLTGLMVLLFLRDWRSVIVVVLNIPFALCGAIVGALADRPDDQPHDPRRPGAGHRHPGRRGDGRGREHPPPDGGDRLGRPAVRRGNQQTAVPRLLAMLCVLAVFLPSFFMQGAAQALFVPLSLAVGFAMVASYLLSSTFVPVLSVWLLRHHHHRLPTGAAAAIAVRPARATPTARAVGGVVRLALAGRAGLPRRPRSRSSCWSGETLGLEIFPKVDAGQFQLRMRAPDGTRTRRPRSWRSRRSRRSRQEVGPRRTSRSRSATSA